MKKFKHNFYINNEEDEDASTYPLYPGETNEPKKTTDKIKTGLKSLTENEPSSGKIKSWRDKEYDQGLAESEFKSKQ
jgi:hypothetical protein